MSVWGIQATVTGILTQLILTHLWTSLTYTKRDISSVRHIRNVTRTLFAGGARMHDRCIMQIRWDYTGRSSIRPDSKTRLFTLSRFMPVSYNRY